MAEESRALIYNWDFDGNFVPVLIVFYLEYKSDVVRTSEVELKLQYFIMDNNLGSISNQIFDRFYVMKVLIGGI